MTREEAIEHLKNMKMPHDKFYEETDKTNKALIDKGNEALGMAIESLENSIDYRDLDDTIMRLNEQGWEITRYEYKRIDGVLFEMKQTKELKNE